VKALPDSATLRHVGLRVLPVMHFEIRVAAVGKQFRPAWPEVGETGDILFRRRRSLLRCSVCVGSFMLTAAGVLRGKRAATHWMHAHLLAQRHPEVQVEPDAIFVRDGRVWSSADVTTGIDVALALIEEDCGREVAIMVARILVVYLKRAGGQSQYSALLAAQDDADSDKFTDLERWITENLTADLRVEALAERTNMSARNFARSYASKRGRTPAKAVEAIRLDTARRLLEETEQRIEAVAAACGYRGEEQMRASFVRALKIPPREYRRRFTTSKRPTN
jgi:transcriptional regulator GlxA family with amidase domain